MIIPITILSKTSLLEIFLDYLINNMFLFDNINLESLLLK
jgi:hypothetical protein